MEATDEQIRRELRASARREGLLASQAAVELLIRCEFARPGYPWIIRNEDPDAGPLGYTADFERILDETVPVSGSQRRLLAIVASLAGRAEVNLADGVAGLDRTNIALVLAAIAHANGTHEDRGDGLTTGFPPGLFPWPAEQAGEGPDSHRM
ncbi:hypothetical protein [Pengzhenrongella sp.]|uniref:hypothetical protein n=1 Tax=Pengzhenrongella sp. TaxID=2888820 RepID=UPI002F951658